MPHDHGGQKKAPSTLKLDLQMVINHHIGTRNPTQAFCKNKCFLPLSHLSSHPVKQAQRMSFPKAVLPVAVALNVSQMSQLGLKAINRNTSPIQWPHARCPAARALSSLASWSCPCNVTPLWIHCLECSPRFQHGHPFSLVRPSKSLRLCVLRMDWICAFNCCESLPLIVHSM